MVSDYPAVKWCLLRVRSCSIAAQYRLIAQKVLWSLPLLHVTDKDNGVTHKFFRSSLRKKIQVICLDIKGSLMDGFITEVTPDFILTSHRWAREWVSNSVKGFLFTWTKQWTHLSEEAFTNGHKLGPAIYLPLCNYVPRWLNIRFSVYH